jgi:hypothetical protein
MDMSPEEQPAAALPVAAAAIVDAIDLGHRLDYSRWRRLGTRVFAVPCEYCDRLVMVYDVPSVGWKAGGTATTAFCDA